VAGITYRVRGSGPPLVLMPLDLTPSQWEPLIEPLSARYCTICLGGPLLGVVAILEARGRSDYLSVVRTVLDRGDIKPGDVVLEVGGGSGSPRIEDLDNLGKIGERAGQPVDLVDDDGIDPPRRDVRE
jgi:hypothetical protein